MKTAILTVDIGFGDSGKGSIVDALCKKFEAGLVVRYSGGAQAAHHVWDDEGRFWHRCSQFGAGALRGIETYLGPDVLVNPLSLQAESRALERLMGHRTPDLLYVDSHCPIITPYHVLANRISATLHNDGSCGAGIGSTRWYRRSFGSDAVLVGDLHRVQTYLIDKLRLLQERLFEECRFSISEIFGGSRVNADFLLRTLHQLRYTPPLEVARELTQAAPRHICRGPVPTPNTVIFEGAQGTLLDEYYGFQPHVTWSTVTLDAAMELLQAMFSSDDLVTSIGIMRSHMTRHGAGPLPTECDQVPDHLACNELNEPGRWQGRMRYGALDFPMLQYGAAAAGVLNGLAVTWLDALPLFKGRVCVAYGGCEPLSLAALGYSPGDMTRPMLCIPPDALSYEWLSEAGNAKELVAYIENRLSLPVLVESYGPAALAKVFSTNEMGTSTLEVFVDAMSQHRAAKPLI